VNDQKDHGPHGAFSPVAAGDRHWRLAIASWIGRGRWVAHIWEAGRARTFPDMGRRLPEIAVAIPVKLKVDGARGPFIVTGMAISMLSRRD
jgi:hypothetical protein